MDIVATPSASSAPPLLVVVPLSGGLDALYAVPPIADTGKLREFRPNLAAEDSGSLKGPVLDEQFGFHPQLAPLMNLFNSGKLSIVYGTGSPDSSLSHFEATRLYSEGSDRVGQLSSGWLGRYCQARQRPSANQLAISVDTRVPDLLRGAPKALAFPGAVAPEITLPPSWNNAFQAGLQNLYKDGNDVAAKSGRDSLGVLKWLGRRKRTRESGARYPDSQLGRGLSFVAELVRADMGVEVAVVPSHGWDSHSRQTAQIDERLHDLAVSIDAFLSDLSDRPENVTLMTMTEFGRRVRENPSQGTDHGRASAMLLAGSGMQGGVNNGYQSCPLNHMDRTGNLKVAIDYREVVGSLLASVLTSDQQKTVFPGLSPGKTL